MGLYSNRPNRLVIPRWRGFKETSKAGELAKDKSKSSPQLPVISIQKQLENWDNKKSIINAIELVNSAFVINKKHVANEAAKFIIENCTDENHLTLKISKLIINEEIDEEDKKISVENSFQNIHLKISYQIQEIRTRLKHYPHNTILWIDYARWLTVIGKFSEAERCIRTAIQLSPTNVFVIRSAVRFFLHIHKYDKKGKDSLSFALQLIRKNPFTKTDPWLMATEISLCAYLEKTSNLMKAGFSMIDAKKFSPFALSELSAALATEELKNGSNKSSKKLFTSSLIDPNENTTAQAEWATGRLGELPVNYKKTNSFEASSYHNLQLENWEQSFDDALNWVIDQPFSREPTNHASYLAGAIVDNNALAIKICNFGLRSNPNEFTLLNNKAYSLAVEHNSVEAAKTFTQINFNSLTDREKVTYTATKGLIQYCKGDNEGGSILYDEAEALAIKQKDEKNAFLVKIYKARAEFIFDCCKTDEKTAINNLLKDLDKFKHPDTKKIVDNLKKRLNIKTKEPDKTKTIYL
jgi:hypothetical protein